MHKCTWGVFGRPRFAYNELDVGSNPIGCTRNDNRRNYEKS